MSVSNDLDSTSISELYAGETKPRNIGVATFVTLLCPGLGYMYVGRLITGLIVNFLLILMVEGFIISHALLKFFPLGPLIVLIAAWATFCILSALDVRDILRKQGTEEYLLKPYNHWVVYVLVLVCGFALPLMGSLQMTLEHLWSVVPLEHAGMYPTIAPGDVVLVDRRGFQEIPAKGDIVAVSSEPTSTMHMLRVVGTPSDTIRYEGQNLYINNKPIEHTIYRNEDPEQPKWLERGDMLAMVEHNSEQRYLITMARGPQSQTSIPATRIGKGELFLLTDNRSQVPIDAFTNAKPKSLTSSSTKMRDSREFGSISSRKLRGKPLFVLWSTDSDSGRTRWDRIGIRIQ